LLATERLLLRRPTPADVAAPPAWLRDPEVMDWLGGVEPSQQLVQRWLEDWQRYPAAKFLVETRDGEVIGRVGFNFYDERTWLRSRAPDAVPELGWALAREHWGHGYATEAAVAVRDWLDAPRVISLIHRDNLRSQAVARRLGAVPGAEVQLPDGGPHVIWEH
jgi:RimJ/RimL family protein N-acetyltransferase